MLEETLAIYLRYSKKENMRQGIFTFTSCHQHVRTQGIVFIMNLLEKGIERLLWWFSG